MPVAQPQPTPVPPSYQFPSAVAAPANGWQGGSAAVGLHPVAPQAVAPQAAQQQGLQVQAAQPQAANLQPRAYTEARPQLGNDYASAVDVVYPPHGSREDYVKNHLAKWMLADPAASATVSQGYCSALSSQLGELCC